MKIVLGSDTLSFKDKLTFGDQLDLTDVQQKYASQGMSYRELILSMMRIFIESINEEKNVEKNITYISNITGDENISKLADEFMTHVESFGKNTEKKSKKSNTPTIK